MNNDKLIKKLVYSLLFQYNIHTVTLDNLVNIIENEGYQIIEFDLVDAGTNHILSKLQLTDYAQNRKAFTYKQGTAKFVFLFENLSANEKLMALSHEAGHIFCGHLKDGDTECSVDEEFAANEFAHHLLYPNAYLKVRQWISFRKKRLMIALLILAAALLGTMIIASFVHSLSYHGNYYITATGEKYHQEDCIFIKDKTNTERLTEEDYNSGKYTPCQLCLPD